MEKKTIITRVNNGTAYCEFLGNTAIKCDIFYDDEKSILGSIYVGYVSDIVKNIGCAFVEYEPGKKAYLQLSDSLKPIFLNRKNTDKICSGDRIIIQISKEAIKTKNPVCTTEFELVGKYAVLCHGEKYIGFSKKIKDNDYREKMTRLIKARIQKYNADNIGVTVRTNAYNASEEDILAELDFLYDKYNSLIKTAYTRSKNFLLHRAESVLISLVRDMDLRDEDRIVTDDERIYEWLGKTGYFKENKIELYNDDMLPLYKLCSLERVFDDITNRKIWLKSGAYLIIDYTEAMTVIDVNTGKCDKGKDREKTFLSVNIEAAKEIARLLALRNISGIIIVDFIDMEADESRERLIAAMREYSAAIDKIPVNVADFTRLNLMEITRRKTRDRVKIRENLF